eukprot:3192600-Alexandrium_andersonii.AAC.1
MLPHELVPTALGGLGVLGEAGPQEGPPAPRPGFQARQNRSAHARRPRDCKSRRRPRPSIAQQ